MNVWEPLPDKIERKFKKCPNPYTLGNILVMVRTCQHRRHRDGHHDHGQNVPKGQGDQHLFEFLLYLIRKWFPDVHGAHPGVGGVSGSGP